MGFRSLFIIVLALFMVVPVTFAQETAGLDGTHWQLVTIGGHNVIEGTRITLVFGADNSAGGSGGCNSYGSTYMLTESGGITFSDVFSTLMACLDNGVMEQEMAYFAALQSASASEIRSGQLVITYGDSETLVFEPALALPDTQWRLVSLGGEPVIEGSEITLEFDPESSAMGSGGCNQYTGTYTTEGQTLAFGAIISTEMACPNNDVMEQETAYFAALAAATRYAIEIEANTLTISYGDAGESLVLERVLDLSETAWQLDSMSDTTVSTPITLVFDDAGGAAGSGGCNQYSSTYTLSGDVIRFSGVISTRMACEGDVMHLETAYFRALQATEQVELANNRLTLTTPDGQTLVFTPANTISNQP